MTATELVWLIHSENVARLAEGKSPRMRSYLTAAGDVDMLRAWDAGKFKEVDDQ